MDQMRKSRSTQGNYFAQIGEPGESDEALILIDKVVKTTSIGGALFIAITQDGPISVFSETVAGGSTIPIESDQLSETILRLANKPPDQKTIGSYHHISENGYYGVIDLETIKPITSSPGANYDLLEEVIKRSIDQAESPHKIRMDAAQKSISVASNISSIIQKLPPRA